METGDKYRAPFTLNEAEHVFSYVRPQYAKMVSIKKWYFLYVALNSV